MLLVDCYLLHVISLLFITGVSCDELTTFKKQESSVEGSTFTLSYTYHKTVTTEYFFWYRQHPGEPPEFLISHYGKQPKQVSRLSATVSGEDQVNLQVSSAAVADSALYYCAVKPTVTANPQLLYKNTSVSCEERTQVKTQESSVGSPFTISYTYHTSVSDGDNFFWYRQYPGEPPELLISRYGTQNKIDTRLSATVSGDKQVDLQVSSAAVTDSALYYCAVKPTVTANPQSLYKNTS
ncbi:uncharacterized protein LOC142884268 [Nelusetta ayraudi]|uniref:uncharacterized protein LOC142884268 n=1 Tax=Nelusetta ayraudi TaxID=303726 RepID=UPI003F6F4E0F